MTLTLQVEKTDFDPSASSLHINGRVTVENPYVKLGGYHRIDLEVGRNFTLGKKEWDLIALERINDACDVGKKAEVGAIVAQEGLANICLITEHMTIVRQRIEMTIARKGRGTTSHHEKGLGRFYEQVYHATLDHFDLNTVKVILVASPGFTNQAILNHIMTQATLAGNKTLLQARSRFLLVHSHSGHRHALQEILSLPEVASQLKETKYARETLMLQKFWKMLQDDELRAWYGEAHVSLAVDRGAVGALLLTDELFRSSSVVKRKRFVQMVEDVRAQGGEVLIFSAMHESGKQLQGLTGCAAILTFPMDVEILEQEEKDEQERKQMEALNVNPNHVDVE